MIPTRYCQYQGKPFVRMYILRDSVELVCIDVNNPINVLSIEVTDSTVNYILTDTLLRIEPQLPSPHEMFSLVGSPLVQVQLKMNQYKNDKLYRNLMTSSVDNDLNQQYSFFRGKIVPGAGSSIALVAHRTRIPL